MEQQQLLRDAAIQPTGEVVAAALGAANEAYVKFNEEAIKHGIQVEWHYYNDAKAWLGKALYKWASSRGTPKEMTAFWLSVWDGFFRVGFMFPIKYRAEMANLPLSPATRKMIENSEQMGKMKIFPLAFDLGTDELFGDIFALVEYKKTLK